MNYRNTRNYENFEKMNPFCVGFHDIPIVCAEKTVQCNKFIGFNKAKRYKEPRNVGIHFFLDDYQFVRIWNNPNTYIQLLQKFACVFTPDFSTYTDFPKALQIYNHYRKHWIGAYWQRNGIKVIPTISWSDKESYSWCFDGEPQNGIVAVSSVGCMKSKESRRLFLAGYEEMMKRLEPEQILFYGTVPAECEGNIVRIESFTEKFERKDEWAVEEAQAE